MHVEHHRQRRRGARAVLRRSHGKRQERRQHQPVARLDLDAVHRRERLALELRPRGEEQLELAGLAVVSVVRHRLHDLVDQDDPGAIGVVAAHDVPLSVHACIEERDVGLDRIADGIPVVAQVVHLVGLGGARDRVLEHADDIGPGVVGEDALVSGGEVLRDERRLVAPAAVEPVERRFSW